ncbi:hypothetical protein [Paenibacillus apis]|uniref:Uncharacterized protein n=1 Tax=Paenibacillus apis TaxID=1792174 RepID=A0A920CM20_9BACL|nr:hypothetical protein [Paenibacillus apis]GIO42163.1 hypothetical protein J41TS4_19210 [Paenibacillus apis]
MKKGNTGNRRFHLVFLIMAMVIFASVFSGCASKPDLSKKKGAYVVTIDGVEISPRKSTVKDLTNSGFQVAVREGDGDEAQYFELDSSMRLAANTSYYGNYLFKNDVLIAHLTLTGYTGVKSATVADIESISVDVADIEGFNVLIEGVPASEVTVENVEEKFPGIKPSGDNFELQNEDKYRILVSVKDGKIEGFTCNYLD